MKTTPEKQELFDALLREVEACEPSSEMPAYWRKWRFFEERLENIFSENDPIFLVSLKKLRQLFQIRALLASQKRGRAK